MNCLRKMWLGLLAYGSLSAQPEPTVTAKFKAVSDLGRPVVGAQIQVTTFVRWQPGEGFGKDIWEGPTGVTDAAGLVTLSVPSSRGEIHYGASLDGYYRAEGQTYSFKKTESGQWSPENPLIEVVVKPILDPVPVFARRTKGLKVPVVGMPIGFDLMKSDWVAPHGKGQVADFIFEIGSDLKSPTAPFEAVLTLRFSNDGDGIQGVDAPPFGGSRFRLPRYAPEDRYSPELTLRRTRLKENGAVQSDEREWQNYFFRVRTQKRDGKILSALYGKISGNIEFWENGVIRFAYYLNPEPLSRNMEFDMGKNQIRGLKGYEVINDP